jgi:hypothetical protein
MSGGFSGKEIILPPYSFIITDPSLTGTSDKIHDSKKLAGLLKGMRDLYGGSEIPRFKQS